MSTRLSRDDMNAIAHPKLAVVLLSAARFKASPLSLSRRILTIKKFDALAIIVFASGLVVANAAPRGPLTAQK